MPATAREDCENVLWAALTFQFEHPAEPFSVGLIIAPIVTALKGRFHDEGSLEMVDWQALVDASAAIEILPE